MDEIFKSFKLDTINDGELRKFTCWGSVEVKDRHNEIIPAEEVYKVMDIWMDRGAPIMFNHTNRQIGKGLNWQPLEKNGNPGVLITATIYKHYAEDDEVWKGIKEGKFEGLSIGGKSYQKEETEDGTYLRKLIGYEFSVVENCGNQEATFEEVNMLAKNKQMVKEEIKKEGPIVEEQTTEDKADDVSTQLVAAIEKLNSRMDAIEEKISGSASEEEAVEEQKAEAEGEDESKEPESEEPDEDDVAKNDPEVEELKKEIAEIKKTLKDNKVVEVIKSDRPDEVEPKKESIEDEVEGKLEEMKKSGKISFVEMGRTIQAQKERIIEQRLK